MMLYLFTPAYIQLIIKHPTYRWLPALMMAWCIVLQYVSPIHDAVGHIEIFWSRVPIFLLGINMGAAVKEKKTIEAFIHLVNNHHFHRDTQYLYLFGTGQAWPFSTLFGAYALHSPHHHWHNITE